MGCPGPPRDRFLGFRAWGLGFRVEGLGFREPFFGVGLLYEGTLSHDDGKGYRWAAKPPSSSPYLWRRFLEAHLGSALGCRSTWGDEGLGFRV